MPPDVEDSSAALSELATGVHCRHVIVEKSVERIEPGG
jgi:hypothetical protein